MNAFLPIGNVAFGLATKTGILGSDPEGQTPTYRFRCQLTSSLTDFSVALSGPTEMVKLPGSTTRFMSAL